MVAGRNHFIKAGFGSLLTLELHCWNGACWNCKFSTSSQISRKWKASTFLFQVQVAPDSYIHVRIFEPLPHMKKDPELVAIELLGHGMVRICQDPGQEVSKCAITNAQVD